MDYGGGQSGGPAAKLSVLLPKGALDLSPQSAVLGKAPGALSSPSLGCGVGGSLGTHSPQREHSWVRMEDAPITNPNFLVMVPREKLPLGQRPGGPAAQPSPRSPNGTIPWSRTHEQHPRAQRQQGVRPNLRLLDKLGAGVDKGR